MSKTLHLILVAFVLLMLAPPFAACMYLRAQDNEETTQQAPTKVTDPQFVVVYNFKRTNDVTEPLLNLRIVVYAKSEGDAIVKATAYLQRNFGATLDLDKVAYQDVGPMRKPEEKKETPKK